MLCLRPLESRFSQHWQASERPVYQAGAVLMAALLLTVPGYGLRSFAVRPRPPLFVSHLNPLHVAKPSAGLAAVEAPPPLHARTQSFPRLPAPTHLRLVSAPTPAEAVVLPRALVPLVRVSADYPALARPAGVVGQVVVAVRIAPDGSVSEATARSGDGRLIPAALDAAHRWRYLPFTPTSNQSAQETTISFPFAP